MNRTPPPNRTWRTVDGVVLKVWAPPPGAPLLAICWWPLQHAIRWMGLAGVHDLLHLDEVRFVGVVRRSSLPDVFIYLHDRTLRELYVDDTGMTYRLRPLRKEPTRGRFTTCGMREALARCRLTHARSQQSAVTAETVMQFLTGELVAPPRCVPWRTTTTATDERVLEPLDLTVHGGLGPGTGAPTPGPPPRLGGNRPPEAPPARTRTVGERCEDRACGLCWPSDTAEGGDPTPRSDRDQFPEVEAKPGGAAEPPAARPLLRLLPSPGACPARTVDPSLN